MIKELSGKKLLILAGAAVHCKVVEAAKQLGVYTIVTDYLDGSPAKVIADEQWDLNVFDVDSIVEKCKERQVDGVLNFCIDPAQRPYQMICEKLHLPCYGNFNQFYTLTDKPTFKSFCVANGVDVISSYTEQDVENGCCEYPLFIKPTDSRGSRGQAVAYNSEQAVRAIACAKKESTNGKVVIEKFMQGKQDFSMTYFVCNGEPYLIRTCDRYLGRMEDNLHKQCVACISPSRYSELYVSNVHEIMKKFIRVLGIQNGPIFMQGFVDGETIRFYDPGLRFPGGEYERLLKCITNADMMSALIEFALTGKIVHDHGIRAGLYRLEGSHTIQLPITARPGKIAVMEGLDVIRKNPKVTAAFKRYEIGETVPKTGDVRQRICEIAMVIDPGESVSEYVSWVQSCLTVQDEHGENMLVSLVEPSTLLY